MWRIAVVVLLLTVFSAQAEEQSRWSSEYDDHFRKYSKRYFGPNFDWRWFKAQAITESHLNPTAISSAGAQGLMQILPTTFADIRAENPHYIDIYTPKWNIAAGIFYNRYLFTHKRLSNLGEEQRLMTTFAAYNAGLGGVINALNKTAPPADRWQKISPNAPWETQLYVKRIQDYKKELY